MSGHPTLEEDRIVWIMGSSRSGSTWLLRMLCELDGAIGIDDPHLGHHLGVWRPIPLAWACADERPELTTLADLKRDKPSFFFSERYEDTWRPLLRELILGRFAAQAAGSNGPVFVKEPGAQAAGLILSLFPRSRLVFLLRDGRDVVDSWLAAYQDGSWAQDEGAFPLAPDGREAFVRWQASVWAHRTEAVADAYGSHGSSRRVCVRYEDLLADTPAELARICESIGKSPDHRRLAAIAEAHAFDALPEAAKGERREVRSGEPGAWLENLSAAERRAMLAELGPTLERFGYASRGVLSAA